MAHDPISVIVIDRQHLLANAALFSNCIANVEENVRPVVKREIVSRLVPIEASEIHVQIVTGESVPVLFAAGSGCWSDHWRPVLEMLPIGFEGIAYDRPGLGLSKSSSGARNVHQMSLELFELLEALKVERAILVGHSFSASVLRMFEQMFPEKVLALLFVDGWHESFEAWEERQSKKPSKVSEAIFFMLGRLGLFSLINKFIRRPKPDWCSSEARWRKVCRNSVSRKFFRTTRREMAAFSENKRLLEPNRSIEAPVSCLVCQQTLDPREVLDQYPQEEHNVEWLAASSRLAKRTSGGRLTVLQDMHHMFLLSEPKVIVDEIVYLAGQLALRTGI